MTDGFVKTLREQPTDAEGRLWEKLRRKQVEGLRFRRQYKLGRYVVDFVCLPARLIVEVDGGQHATEIVYEKKRTAWLESQGFTVIRFWNNDVLGNIDGVVQTVMSHPSIAGVATPPPTPSRKGRG